MRFYLSAEHLCTTKENLLNPFQILGKHVNVSGV
jgi:hypothetical protein